MKAKTNLLKKNLLKIKTFVSSVLMMLLLASFLVREKSFFYPLQERGKENNNYVYILDLEGVLLPPEVYVKDPSIIIDGHNNTHPLPHTKLVVRSSIARSSIELVERITKKK